ncbi:MAG: hypothetical protein ABIO72_00655 [Patescibacteria group bacterium]
MPKKPETKSVIATRLTDDVAEKRHAKAVDEGLQAIFKTEEGGMPDLKTFTPRSSRWWVYAFIGVAVFLIALTAAAWAGFSLFRPFRGFSGQGLAITIEGPERVSLGQETTYFINYQNRTSEPIAGASVRVSFPTDFVIAGVEPQPNGENATEWRLGSMPVDGRGTIKIHGTFTGAIGTATAIQVVGSYRPASFNSDFDALATKILNYTDSVLVGSLKTPAKVLPGDHVTLSYHLENHGKDPFQNLHVRFTLPQGFQLDATSTGVISGDQVELPLGTLAADASSTVRVSGVFSSGSSGEAHLVVEAGHASAENTFLASQRTETSFTVLAGDLSLKLVLNGQDSDVVTGYDGALRFGLSYENTASENLEDVQLLFHLEAVSPNGVKLATLADWSSLIENASATRSGNDLTWDKSGVSMLQRLPPHNQGTLGFSLDALPVASGTSGLVIRAVLEAKVKKVGTTDVNRIVRAAPITITYLTDATVSAEARYNSEEGAPLGSGPLPPVVGKPTTYRIQWALTKHVDELSDSKIHATLPTGVAWAGKTIVNAGAVAYDEPTRTVTWALNRLPKDIGEEELGFDVTITPGEADADRFAKLLGETRFEATDSTNGQKVLKTSPALSTDLENDESARGKGVVRKP